MVNFTYMKTILAISVGKLIRQSSRLLKIGGGSAAPGLYALRTDPHLIKNLSKQIPTNIIITGTNGKTTTSRLLAHFLKADNRKFIHNSTGSNLERGIASTLLSHVNIFGKISNIDVGIWEMDEAAFNHVAAKLNPKTVVFLNAFRDQLDRYGEVDTVVKNWAKTSQLLKHDPIFILNADDGNTQDLSKHLKGKILRFSLDDHKISGERITKNNKSVNFQAKNIQLKGLEGSTFELLFEKSSYTVNLPIPGIYQIYNFLAAFAVGIQIGIEPDVMIESLTTFSTAFGRMEKIQFGKNQGFISLIKNPVGTTQVFETIAPNIKSHDRLLIALNDNFADGTDVSWIWDANFEVLSRQSSAIRIICSGSRAYELGLRLKYAGLHPNDLEIEPNLVKAFNKAKSGLKGNLFMFPTYTAMLNLQHILAKTGVKKNYWEEN